MSMATSEIKSSSNVVISMTGGLSASSGISTVGNSNAGTEALTMTEEAGLHVLESNKLGFEC